MKKVFALFALLFVLSFSSCTEECECETLEDGTIECPC